MPQLDKFTYFSQFLWLCLLLFTFYSFICNDRDGVLAISRLLKLRNQLQRKQCDAKTSQSKDPNSFQDLVRKALTTGVSYMYESLAEVSQWCQAVDLVGKSRKRTLISCFGEICGSRAMERNILDNLSQSSPSGRWITCQNCRNERMLIHLVHGQGSIR